MNQLVTYHLGTKEKPLVGRRAGVIKLAGVYQIPNPKGQGMVTYRYIKGERTADVEGQNRKYDYSTPNGGIKPDKPKFIDGRILVNELTDPCLKEFLDNYPVKTTKFFKVDQDADARESIQDKKLRNKAMSYVLSLSDDDLIDLGIALEEVDPLQYKRVNIEHLLADMLEIAEDEPESIIGYLDDELREEVVLVMNALKQGILEKDNPEGSRIKFQNGTILVENKRREFALFDAALKVKTAASIKDKLQKALGMGLEEEAPNLIQTTQKATDSTDVDLQDLTDVLYDRAEELKHCFEHRVRYFYLKEGDVETKMISRDNDKGGKKGVISFLQENPDKANYLLNQVKALD